MNIILGVGTLVIVLVIMTLFLKFAYGKEGLQALSGAACATFLPQPLKLCYWWHFPY